MLIRLLGAVHAALYRLSGGRVGGRFGRWNLLLLETAGARSGRPHAAPLLYGRDGDNLVLVASWGGSARHPAWYRNLLAQPEVSVRIGGRRHPMRARTASGQEKARLWQLMVRLWPGYDGYQRRTEREIPVVVLEPR